MALTVDGLQLFTAQESTNAVAGSPEVIQPPGRSPAETLLINLEAEESTTVSGVATGIRISGQAGFSSDPQTALAEWLQELESLVSPDQGDGWTVVDDERNRNTTAVVTAISWTFAFGDYIAARWTLDATRGEGVMPSSTRSPSTDSPNNTSTLAGEDLDTVTEKRTEVQLPVDVTPIALGNTSETIIVPNSGVRRRMTITGRKSGTDSERRSFDDTLLGKVGGNQEVTYQTGLPGSSYDGIIGDYDSTWNAGQTGTLDYALTFTQGSII